MPMSIRDPASSYVVVEAYIPAHAAHDRAMPMRWTRAGPILSESAPKGIAPRPKRIPEHVISKEIEAMESANSSVRRRRSGGTDRMHA